MERHLPWKRVRFGALASSLVSLCAAGALLSTSAYAQEPEDDEDGSLEEQVTVTGTRIRRDDFSSAQPTTVMDSEYLNNLGIINLGDAMVGVPQNVNRTSPTATPGGNFFNGSTLANLRGLNPFFGSRTLTLVDSRRHVPTNQGDGVDLNFIPTVLIDRMETVTGGASASYGSGAIGGVQNILLDRDFIGFKVELDYGITAESDGDNPHVGFAFGTEVGSSGNLVIGIEAQEMDPIWQCSQARDWCAGNTDNIDNDDWPGDGRAENLVTSNIREAWSSSAGVFWLPGYGGRVPDSGTVIPGIQVDGTGTGLIDYNPGVYGDDFFSFTTIGGEAPGAYDYTYLRSPVERQTLFAAFETEISDNVGFFVEASYGSVETSTQGGWVDWRYECIQGDNAFIDPSQTGGDTTLFDFVNANNTGFTFPCFGAFLGGYGGVPLNKDWRSQLDHGNDTETDLTRISFGFNGQFGDSTWTWDAYYQYGKSERMQLVRDLMHENRMAMALDSVINPLTGQPDCRVNVTPGSVPRGTPFYSQPGRQLIFLPELGNGTLAQGCVPINPFGTGPIDPAAKAYAFGFIRENTDVEQDMLEFVTSGEIGEGWGAGAIQAAAGVSYRGESLDNISAEELDQYIRKDFAIQYGESFAGTMDVWEIFGEIDLPFHEQFSVNVAARQSFYEHEAGFGTRNPGRTVDFDISTWKVGGAWDIVPSLRLRFSSSRDIRAPNFRELYYGQVFTPGSFFGFATNPWTDHTMDPVASILSGGADVQPEEADTNTFGFVIQPQGTNLRFALDYYEIELSNAITPANLSLTLQGCEAGVQSFCDQITGTTTPWADPMFDHNGDPTPSGNNSVPCTATCFVDINTQWAEAFNFRKYEVEGMDFSMDWTKPLANGTFNLRFLATRTFHQIIQPVADPNAPAFFEDIAGVTGNAVGFLTDWASAADLAANLIATWSRGDFSITAQMRHVADGVINPDWAGPDFPGYDPTDPNFETVTDLETANINTIPAYEVYTLSGVYNLEMAGGNRVQLWGTINNLFDEDPPLYGGGTGGTNGIFYDTVGREFRVGVRMNFE